MCRRNLGCVYSDFCQETCTAVVYSNQSGHLEESVRVSEVPLYQWLHYMHELFGETKGVLVREMSSFQGCP